MNTSQENPTPPAWKSIGLHLWAVTAAFGTYFCMYMYRKPFTAASFTAETAAGWEQWDQKAILIAAQVVGYMISKFIGIRVVSEVQRSHRAMWLMGLILLSHAALFLFAIAPAPWHIVCLFLNGLPLGIVFGLVLGFLEGRRMTEALTAGLCASFILAGGVSKTVGQSVLQWTQTHWGWSELVSERWMPFLAGVLFLLPIAGFVAMLAFIPPPTERDETARSKREPMNREDRMRILRTYAVGLTCIAILYLLVSIVRGLRDDFAPELLKGLGATVKSSDYANIDFWVALTVMLVNGSAVFIRNNRIALQSALLVSAIGFVITLLAIGLRTYASISPQMMMVWIGAGLYLPYVAVHTTIFERMIAWTRDRANVGFLMYVADSVGYLGYVLVVLLKLVLPKSWSSGTSGWVPIFFSVCVVSAIASLLLLAIASWSFQRRAMQMDGDQAADR